jgi:hypothetical protein
LLPLDALSADKPSAFDALGVVINASVAIDARMENLMLDICERV